MIHYEVVKQGRYFAVHRRGRKGGTRIVAVYATETVADTVAYRLNLFAKDEV